MFQVFVGSPPVTSLVLGNNGDRAPWHNTGYEQDWKGTQVGFGAPLGASALAPFQSPHVVSAPLAWCGAEPSWEAPAPSWPGSRVPFPVQKQTEWWGQLGPEPLGTVPLLQEHHGSPVLTAVFRQILHVWLEPLAPKPLCGAAGGQLKRPREGFNPSLT